MELHDQRSFVSVEPVDPSVAKPPRVDVFDSILVKASPPVGQRSRLVEAPIRDRRDDERLIAPRRHHLVDHLEFDAVEEASLDLSEPPLRIPGLGLRDRPAGLGELGLGEDPGLEPHVACFNGFSPRLPGELLGIELGQLTPRDEPKIDHPDRGPGGLDVARFQDEGSRHRVADQLLHRRLRPGDRQKLLTLASSVELIPEPRNRKRDPDPIDLEPQLDRRVQDMVPSVHRLEVGRRWRHQADYDQGQHGSIVWVGGSKSESFTLRKPMKSEVAPRTSRSEQGSPMVGGSCMDASESSRWGKLPVLVLAAVVLAGCGHPIPLVGRIHGDAEIAAKAEVETRADVRGELAIRLPAASDPGPMMATVVQPARGGSHAPRVAVVEVDGLLLNQNLEAALGSGENPVAAFREKLEAAGRDGRVAAIVLRIHSPGGGVTACDIMAEELERFRVSTRKPVVACLMDVATAGAYYLAVGADWIVAHPTTLTGGVGVVFNHFNLQDAMAQLNVTVETVKSGAQIDMGSVTRPLDPGERAMLQEMADEFQRRFVQRVVGRRPGLSEEARRELADGRVYAAPWALRRKLVDRLGYVHDAIAEATRLAGVSDAEVVIYHRLAFPARSLYAIAPAPGRLSEAIPFSYPGLDRSKLPSFLYLWQPDPTLGRTSPR